MTAKEYLGQVRHLDSQIDVKLRQAERLKELATKTTATFSDMPKAPGHNRSSMEKTIVKMIDLQNEINDDIDRLVDLKEDVKATIARLDNPTERLLLEKRYLCQESWSKIAEDMNYSEQYVFKIHAGALQKVAKEL